MVPRRTAAKASSIVICAQGQTPKNFLPSQLIQHISYKDIKMCQEFHSSPRTLGGGLGGPLYSSSVSYNIIHLDPGVLIAKNLSNSSSLLKFDHGYRNQAYKNYILGLVEQCGFSYYKQLSTVTSMHVQCDLNACPQCMCPNVSPTTHLTWLYFINTIF